MGIVSLKKTGRWSIALLAALTSICCRPVRGTRDSFQYNYCYDGRTMGLEDKIRVDGYYRFFQRYQRSVGVAEKSYNVPDTLEFTALFLRDGTFRFNFLPNGGAGQVGKYRLAGDTIKVQYIEPPGGMSWSKTEIWFLIIDQSTLQRIAIGTNSSVGPADLAKYRDRDKEFPTSQGTFIPYDKLPDPDRSWLKGRKWFWCDEKAFYQWKAEMKQKGKWGKWVKY